MRFLSSVGIISGVSWTWRALRGHSVTFALLFATTLFGLSVIASFRHLLGSWGAPWYVWLLAPIFAVGYLAKKEAQWLPDPSARRKWARRIFFGSIALALVIGFFRSERTSEAGVANPAAATGAR
ncbi:MAG: hypothetical protein RIQ93_962 [Verrucomicrobiota bacterium]|jgi:hypothetical protein